MSRNEYDRLRDISDAIAAIREHPGRDREGTAR